MNQKKLSIIIPVFNEEKTIVTILDRILAVKISIDKEIIIVNDGSTDNSAEIIDEWYKRNSSQPDCDVIVVNQDNGGKGSGVRTGIAKSTGDVVIIQDGDLEYDPNDYLQCITPILKQKAKVVYGSRELGKDKREYSYATFFLGGLLVTNWMNFLFGSELTDEPTCYKTFDGNLIRNLPIEGNGFEWEPEITAKILRLGYTIEEVPIKYTPRKMLDGKKINWKDGIKALWTAFVYRILPGNSFTKKLLDLNREKSHILKIKKQNRIFAAVLLTCLLLRFLMIIPGWSTPRKTFFRPDSYSYVDSALALVETGCYNQTPTSTLPVTKRPPVFPFCLAAIFFFSGSSLQFSLVFFCLLSTLICVPIYLTGKLLGGFKTGILATILYSLNITSIAITPLFISDTLFTFFVTWQLYYFTRFYLKKRLLYLVITIIMAALATLTRPINLPWIIPCIFLICIMQDIPWRKRIIFASLSLIFFIAILFPWMLRNKNSGAGFRIDSNIGDTFLYHNCAVLKAKITNESPEAIRKIFMKETENEFSSNSAKYPDVDSRLKHMTSRAMGIIKQHPFTYFRLHFRPEVLLPDVATFFENLGITRTGRGTFDVLNQKGLYAAVNHYFQGKLWLPALLTPILLVVLFTYLGCLAELVRWLINKKWFLFFFFLAFIEYYLFLPGPITMPRYHLPALPLMTIMASLFFWALFPKIKQDSKN